MIKGTVVSVWQLYNSLQRHGIASTAGVHAWLATAHANFPCISARCPMCSTHVCMHPGVRT